jgi:hypothetical protein
MGGREVVATRVDLQIVGWVMAQKEGLLWGLSC